MIRASQSRWFVATAVMALAVGGLALVSSPASAGGKSNKPAVVTVDTVPSGQSVTVTYTINRANKAVANQTCTLDGASTPCDTSPNSATGKPVKTTYAVTINGLDNGEHTFAVSFLLADGNGGSNSDIFTINYTPPNRAPVAVDDEVTTSEDTPVTFNVLTNDSDADGDSLMMSQVDLASAHGSVPLESVFATGDVTWVPDANFSGTDSFSYNVWDGEDFDTGTVNITVTPVNDPPDARDDTATTLQDTAVTIDVLANDSDVEGDPFEIDTFFFDPTFTGGSVGRTDDGQFIFTPASDFSGPISFTYTIRSPGGLEDTATVTVTVETPCWDGAGFNANLRLVGPINTTGNGMYYLATDTTCSGDGVPVTIVQSTDVSGAIDLCAALTTSVLTPVRLDSVWAGAPSDYWNCSP